ncbi:MAG: DUF1028 domain-containing protein [Planctomycetota bacterium]|nr:DUF1028 domain-containing protein [Planctomycetota bacterium]
MLPSRSPLVRGLVLALAAILLTAPAKATWSIVVISKKTGEVCCASATCIGGQFPLKRWLPVIVVGKGAAAAQSAVDTTGINRKRIWDGFHADQEPERILELLSIVDGGHQSRQYGIVSFDGAPVTFTGWGAGAGKHGVIGETDELIYAIQGNVITGDPVVDLAEQALLNTPGDLATKVMAGMEAARSMGGDGRCSCSQSDPDGCGSPPPNFTKSAHTAFIVLARLGDSDGTCDQTDGCATGGYYLSLVVKGKDSDPDPILVMQGKYDLWRADLVDHADAVTSIVTPDRDALVADSASTAMIHVELRDVEDQSLTAGGHNWEIDWVGAGQPSATPGPVVDLGGGHYEFPVTATGVVGRGSWTIRCKRPGDRWVQMVKPLVLPTEPLEQLHTGRLSVGAGESVPFTLNRGAADGGQGYLLLGSASGTIPGTPFHNVVIPLQRDPFFGWTWNMPPEFSGNGGVLDASGRAEALLDAPAGDWAPFIGTKLAFCGLIGGPPYDVTNVVKVEVLP